MVTCKQGRSARRACRSPGQAPPPPTPSPGAADLLALAIEVDEGVAGLGHIRDGHPLVQPVDVEVQPPRAVQPQAQDGAFRTRVQVWPKLLADLGGETYCLPRGQTPTGKSQARPSRCFRLPGPGLCLRTCPLPRHHPPSNGCSPPHAPLPPPPRHSLWQGRLKIGLGRQITPLMSLPTLAPAPLFSLPPTHLETVVEDAPAPQQPGRPLKGTGRRGEVEPLGRACDDAQDQGGRPLPVQEVYPHLGDRATTPQSRPTGKRPPAWLNQDPRWGGWHLPHMAWGAARQRPRGTANYESISFPYLGKGPFSLGFRAKQISLFRAKRKKASLSARRSLHPYVQPLSAAATPRPGSR